MTSKLTPVGKLNCPIQLVISDCLISTGVRGHMTGRCVLCEDSECLKKKDKEWKCSAFCKPLTVDSIKKFFEKSVREV